MLPGGAEGIGLTCKTAAHCCFWHGCNESKPAPPPLKTHEVVMQNIGLLLRAAVLLMANVLGPCAHRRFFVLRAKDGGWGVGLVWCGCSHQDVQDWRGPQQPGHPAGLRERVRHEGQWGAVHQLHAAAEHFGVCSPAAPPSVVPTRSYNPSSSSLVLLALLPCPLPPPLLAFHPLCGLHCCIYCPGPACRTRRTAPSSTGT